MKYLDKEISLKECLEKEWIITNGIGGYASSTIIGANTRKYHGLLVAPLMPPARRNLILSKIDESINIKGIEYPIYTNICKNYISEGFKFQENFEKHYIPEFTYKVKDTIIQKKICMQYRKNTVCIVYKITGGKDKALLSLTPIINFRDFHSINKNKINVIQEINENKLKLIVNNINDKPIYIKISEGKYEEHYNDEFRNMYYIEEEKRGFDSEENLSVPGTFKIELNPREEKEISIICSLEKDIDEINAKDIIKNEKERLENIVYNSNLTYKREKDTLKIIEEKKFIKDLIISSDNFVVYRPFFGLHTTIAGYPWFLDWGRDALISFEGLYLKTRRFEIAKDVILTFTKHVKCGLLPNGYSEYDSTPLYNSADSSLLLFEQTKKYLDYTGDYIFVKKELYELLKNIIKSYKNGVNIDNNNIYLDNDNLISSGTSKTQNTWMDAKCGNLAITPRNGKAVEINAMWYNALKILENLCIKYGENSDAQIYSEMAKKTKCSFEEKFYNKNKQCLYDVLNDDKIRPNQLFALSLSYPIIDLNTEIAENILKTVKLKLLNNYGLKTLAQGEKNYVDVYEGNGLKRDMSYHQGITWPWLLGLYNNSLINKINTARDSEEKKQYINEYLEFTQNVEETFKNEFYNNGAIQSISEIYDSKEPYLPKGAFAQAWSVAEILRIIVDKEEIEDENSRN